MNSKTESIITFMRYKKQHHTHICHVTTEPAFDELRGTFFIFFMMFDGLSDGSDEYVYHIIEMHTLGQHCAYITHSYLLWQLGCIFSLVVDV